MSAEREGQAPPLQGGGFGPFSFVACVMIGSALQTARRREIICFLR
jgi:hypothetical protein